jgi:hypothetical protein
VAQGSADPALAIALRLAWVALPGASQQPHSRGGHHSAPEAGPGRPGVSWVFAPQLLVSSCRPQPDSAGNPHDAISPTPLTTPAGKSRSQGCRDIRKLLIAVATTPRSNWRRSYVNGTSDAPTPRLHTVGMAAHGRLPPV